MAEFRKRHLDALAGLFKQALLLCAEAGLVKLGHVAIDGTKIKANASKHKAMSYKRMNETEARLKQEIDALLAAAEKTDAEEDAQYGKDRRGDELPEELQRRESRLKKIREAKAALEQAAKEQAELKRAEAEQKLAERAEEEQRTGKKKRGRKPEPCDPEQARPDDTAQRNFTDPESRIMPDGGNKGSLRARLQRADRGRFRIASDRGHRGYAGDERQEAVAPDDRADRDKSGTEAGEGQRRHRLLQRGECDR